MLNENLSIGVDLNKIRNIHSSLAEQLAHTFRNRDSNSGRVLGSIGHYAGMIDIGGNKVLSLHVDGVGTKVLIAQKLGKFDTIGIDCVAMCVNDLICVGSEPISLVDYIALEKSDKKLVDEIVKGLIEGASRASVSIIGGETAIMPDVIRGFKGKGFDLAAMGIGIAEKNRLVTGSNLRNGDVILGLESSGIHSNGISLARNVLLNNHNIDEFIPRLERTLGEELLIPTHIYVTPILEALKECTIHGLGHITGGSFSKLKRLSDTNLLSSSSVGI